MYGLEGIERREEVHVCVLSRIFLRELFLEAHIFFTPRFLGLFGKLSSGKIRDSIILAPCISCYER